MVFGWGLGGSAASARAGTASGGVSAGPQERAVIADAGVGAATVDSSEFGPGSSSDAAMTSGGGGMVGLAAAMGADDVSWAPLSAGGGSRGAAAKAGRAAGPKETQPYRFQSHAVKAHLKDRGTAVVDLRAVVADAPCDVVFDLLADPHQHEHIFEAIESANATLVSEEGPVRRWRLDYRARWKFWKVGGVCDNRLWMTTDREAGTVSFVLREPGFLRRYEGTWTITGPSGKGPGGAYKTPTTTAATTTAAATAASLPFLQRSAHRRSPSSTSLSSASGHDESAVASPRSLSSKSSRGSSSSGSSSSGSPSPADTPRSAGTDAGGVSGGGGLGSFLAAINNPFMSSHHHSSSGGAATAAPQPQLQPVSPTTIVVSKCMSPKVAPPFPINQVLKGHAVGQVGDMLEGLLLATAQRIQLDEQEREGDKGRKAGAVWK
ncbi:hypothetical protein HXX76_010871 [Chlamydomonas incerta]|uniref:Uncharacterized protein n=1 Tax=Chlamydomonas incerta TaxID=51695 RepID=A0A835VUD6_CHLIN|nr:hypothetical protein HXX76_010871 [Chlamydomonas incerta]|eukprot:KAG2429642.1 hypothetical protein HXX76_010871 [Chlamydomonas incerta]